LIANEHGGMMGLVGGKPGDHAKQRRTPIFNPRSGSGHEARWRRFALPFQTHIRSPIKIGRTNIPLACGKDPGDGTILLLGIESHIMDRFVRLGLPECLAIPFRLVCANGLQVTRLS
jgi:hypothetical protein